MYDDWCWLMLIDAQIGFNQLLFCQSFSGHFGFCISCALCMFLYSLVSLHIGFFLHLVFLYSRSCDISGGRTSATISFDFVFFVLFEFWISFLKFCIPCSLCILDFFAFCISLLSKLWHIWWPTHPQLFLRDRIVKPLPLLLSTSQSKTRKSCFISTFEHCFFQIDFTPSSDTFCLDFGFVDYMSSCRGELIGPADRRRLLTVHSLTAAHSGDLVKVALQNNCFTFHSAGDWLTLHSAAGDRLTAAHRGGDLVKVALQFVSRTLDDLS